MRNLKKVLALVLAMVMSLSLAVTATAAYPDVDKIENLDAVYTLTALGIVEGRDNGDFDPTATLNRAEAAKLVAILNLASNPVPNANGKSDFTDVLGDGSVAWANDFIQYGVAQGSINGIGDGLFAPKANVTGVQLAKMLLGILGYDAAAEGYVGANWEYNVNIDASTANLYKGLEDIDPTAAISRDDAAQMMYNALAAHIVTYLTDSTGALDQPFAKKLWEEKYPFVKAGESVMVTIAYDVEDAEYTYTFANGKELTSAVDYTALLGLNCLYFTDKVAGDEVTLGIYDYYNTVETGLVGDLDLGDEDFEGVQVDKFNPVGANDIHSVTLVGETMGRKECAHDYWTYAAIDNDDDAEFDRVILYPVYYGDVSNDKKDTVDVATKTYVKECNDIYADIENGDVALVEVNTNLVTLNTISELAEQTAVVNSIDCDENGKISEIVIGGTAYEWESCKILKHAPKYWPGKTVDFYVINGYVVELAENTSLAADFLLITAIAHGCNADGKTINATALFADNTTKEITISDLDGVDGTAIRNIVIGYLDQSDVNDQHGYLVRFDEVNGKYELTSTANVNPVDVGFDGAFANYSHPAARPVFWPAANNTEEAFITSGKDIYKIADDAVVFLADTTDGVDYSVVTGADIKNMTGFSFVKVYYAAYESNANGYDYVNFLFMEAAPKYISVDMTGILTSDVTSRFEDGDYYAIFSLYNGEEEITVKAKMYWPLADELYGMKEGDVISFAIDDGKVVKVDAVKGYVAEVTAYDGTTNFADIKLDGVPYDFAADATIWFFDTDRDVMAAYEGVIELAYEGVDNVFFSLNADGDIDFMIVDHDRYDSIVINDINK